MKYVYKRPPRLPPPRLLILACSATKRAHTGTFGRYWVYDGPLWRTWRAVDPNIRKASVIAFSAHYGLMARLCFEEDYDERLTEDIAAQMIAEGCMGSWPKPPKPWRRQGDAFYRAHGGRKKPFNDICLVGGGLYLQVMRALFAEAQAWRPKVIAPDARITEINGPIGKMRQGLRAWLVGKVPATVE